jgi:UDP-glucose 4-epimerase
VVILVTGHRGFLGRAIHERLVAEGRKVIGAGRPDVPIPSAAFRRLVDSAEPEVIVHCAGPASVGDSIRDPAEDRRGSVEVLARLVDEAPDARLLLISSAAVYGEPEALPVAETARIAPISPYGRHRAECERLLLEGGKPSAILRVFSGYGEGLRRQVLWDVCRQALDLGAVQLAGSGEESRDFVHVRDVAQAVSVAIDRSPFGGDVYNVATGTETTIRRLAESLLVGLGSSASLRFSGRPRVGDPARWRADISLIAGLGFTPTITIEEGARTYARWVEDVS